MSKEYTALVAEIEEAISLALPEDVSAAWIERIAGKLSTTPSADSMTALVQPAHDLLRRGGKRWRPAVCLISADLAAEGSGRRDEAARVRSRALPLAVMVELAHNGSLIVDDIEDGAEWRRGALSVHILYGEDTAINSANFLYFLPTFLIDRSPFSAEEKAAFYRMYTEDMRRLHLGQGMDIRWHRDHGCRPGREEYLQMCRLKTGSLARLAARAGLLVGGGDPADAEELGRIFEDAGTAFQILDDVGNLNAGIPGKHRGDDIVEGKKSLPVILAGQGDATLYDRLASCFQRAREEGPASPAVDEAIELLRRTGSIDESQAIASSMLDNATKRILTRYEDSRPRALLLEVLGGFAS